MKKKVYLHIGFNKTGTSAIQEFCRDNTDSLRDDGVLYPEATMKHTGQHALANGLGFDEEYDSPLSMDELQSLKNEINNFTGKKILISSEDFTRSKSLEKLKQFFFEFDVRVVVYFRRQDEWLESYYIQALKMDAGSIYLDSFENYFEHQLKANAINFDYQEFLYDWEEAFGKANIEIGVYRKLGFYGGNITNDFLSRIGIEKDKRYKDVGGSVNPRISYPVILAAQKISKDRMIFSREDYQDLIKIMESLCTDKQKTEVYTVLSKDVKRRIIEKYLSSNNELAKNYFGTECLFSYEDRKIPYIGDLPNVDITALIKSAKKILDSKK